MTTKYAEYEAKLLEAMAESKLEAEEFGELLAVASARMPQPGLYSEKYVKEERERIHTARCFLRKLPHGTEILEREQEWL